VRSLRGGGLNLCQPRTEGFGALLRDATGWAVADLDPNGSDGSWSASSGTLTCTGVIDISGLPDGDMGSIYLIDPVRYQDVRLTCSATLAGACPNARLVFKYRDGKNYWGVGESKSRVSVPASRRPEA